MNTNSTIVPNIRKIISGLLLIRLACCDGTQLRYREAEVKHGRVAMLAYVGLVVPDFARLPDPIFHQKAAADLH